MVYGHVLGDGKTVVGFQAVQVGDVSEAGSQDGLHHGFVGMGEDQPIIGAQRQLLLQQQWCRAVPPALDTWDIRQLDAQPGGVLPRLVLAGENDAGGTIRDLAAVLLAHTALDHGIEFIVAAEGALGKFPGPGLGPGIAFGIAEVDLRDGVQVVAVDAVALVILPGNAVEQERPGEVAVGGLPALPGGAAQVLRAGLAVDVAHQLQAKHTGGVVVPRLDVAHGGQDGDGARGAGRLVARGRQHGQLREYVAEEAADETLAGEQFGDEVADMTHLDFPWLDIRVHHRLAQRLGEHVVQAQALARPVAGEVGLAAAQDVDVC